MGEETITVHGTFPIEMSLDIPTMLRGDKGDTGDKGDKGDVGESGTCFRGTWLPVIGGMGGESGQVYHFQSGTFRKYAGHVECWGYVQFAALGTIVGNLILKGLPYKTALIPHPVGGMSSYFSNPHPDSPQMLCLRANGGQDFAWIDGLAQQGFNPQQLTVNALNPATQIVFSFSYPTD